MAADRSPIRLGYLTSLYGRASDTFIRIEVEAVRSLGHDVRTFSIRRPAAAEVVNEEIRRVHAETEYILEAGLPRLVLATLRETLRSPGRMLAAVKLAARVRTPGLKGHLLPVIYLMEAAFLAQRLRALGIGHLHDHIAENSAAVAMIAAELAGISFSLTIHGPSEFDRPTELALDLKIGRSAFVVAVTQFGRSQLYRWSDQADWPKIKVIYSGIEPMFLDRELDPPPDVPRFVCVGRLAEQKGHLVLVEAAGLVAAEGLAFEIIVIGDGTMRRPIEAAIARLGLGDRVRLVGWKSPREVLDAVLDARAFVLPSFAEGLPMVIMEAQALGRPVISTYIAGIPELVETGASGWLVPAGSVEDLARAMREALACSAEDLARLGREGSRRAAAQHELGFEARALSALFQQAVGREPFAGPADDPGLSAAGVGALAPSSQGS